jgi:membrane associated rhomboid family serine protease
MSANYYQRQYQRPVWGQPLANSMIGKLILANIVVFFLQYVFRPHFSNILALSPRSVIESFTVWQMFTYMFLHGGFMHLLFNMLMLWLFGSTLERIWGSKQFLRYYIVCGFGGAVFSLVFSYNNYVLGASGAIFGLYLAYAMMFPDNHVYLYFLVPVKAKYLVAGLAIFQLVQGISGPSGVAYFAHLGGMAAGLFFFRDTLSRKFMGTRTTRRRWNAFTQQRQQKQEEGENTNIDSILDKISAKGYDKLTTTEKRILENYSRKQKEDTE